MSKELTTGRLVAASAAAFVVSQILAIVVHGFILAPDYQPYYGTLLRPMDGEPKWQMLLLPVSHLSFILALVWVYARIARSGRWLAQGLTLGVVGWMLGQLPLWLLWYAEQPWPGTLVVKQLALELISSIIIGLTIAAVARVPHREDAVRSVTPA